MTLDVSAWPSTPSRSVTYGLGTCSSASGRQPPGELAGARPHLGHSFARPEVERVGEHAERTRRIGRSDPLVIRCGTLVAELCGVVDSHSANLTPTIMLSPYWSVTSWRPKDD